MPLDSLYLIDLWSQSNSLWATFHRIKRKKKRHLIPNMFLCARNHSQSTHWLPWPCSCGQAILPFDRFISLGNTQKNWPTVLHLEVTDLAHAEAFTHINGNFVWVSSIGSSPQILGGKLSSTDIAKGNVPKQILIFLPAFQKCGTKRFPTNIGMASFLTCVDITQCCHAMLHKVTDVSTIQMVGELFRIASSENVTEKGLEYATRI